MYIQIQVLQCIRISLHSSMNSTMTYSCMFISYFSCRTSVRCLYVLPELWFTIILSFNFELQIELCCTILSITIPGTVEPSNLPIEWYINNISSRIYPQFKTATHWNNISAISGIWLSKHITYHYIYTLYIIPILFIVKFSRVQYLLSRSFENNTIGR